MKRKELATAPVSELIGRFETIGVAQDRAIADDDTAKFNRLFDDLKALEQELKLRPGDQRRLLLELFQHRNMQVRLNAAKATLAVAPEAARKMLEQIANSGWFPQAGDAGMCLARLESGAFRPT